MPRSVFTWLWQGCAWRVRQWRTRRFLLRTFANGRELLHAFTHRHPADAAVLRNGATLRHPAGQIGLPETLVEVWHRQVYTGRFYRPAPGDVVIDAGANVGLFSIHVARRAPGATVLAFEPVRDNFEALRDNVAATGAAGVKPVLACLSRQDGQATMRKPGGRSLDYRAQPRAGDAATAAPGPDADTVPMLSWPSVMRLAGGGPIALFKLDIEGSERAFLAGATPEDVKRVERFAIEYHDVIEPGCLAQVRATLGPTHDLRVEPEGAGGYGMVYATRRAA